ncbi:MAG TPA: hypothetical protein VHN17_04230 [Steroidobacteraceae bacterium]|jgi:hypothetical protein|nr:hypothetical protein [Steroidobacteraceae bacterium]
MFTCHHCIPGLLVLSALTACSSGPPKSGPVGASSTYVTGSHIAVPVDARTGAPDANPGEQQVSSLDIARTGQTDVAAALRLLVPAAH